jgi:hypothetical protein
MFDKAQLSYREVYLGQLESRNFAQNESPLNQQQ